MTRVDVHQHVWTAPLCDALARRSAPPRLIRARGGGWLLELDGEPAAPLTPDDVAERAALVAADGLDIALVALSGPLGIEGLAPDEATALLHAYEDGLDALPGCFGGWGAVALREPDSDDVDALLDRGRVGLCLPSGAVDSPAALHRAGTLLERLERRGAPLFVHPGPSPWSGPAAGPPPSSRPPAPAVAATPPWWPALTGYVASMNAAWHAWVAAGRAAHPRLRVVFAMLAGGAPLQLERLAGRAGDATASAAAHDPLTFYDSSSFGPVALGAAERLVGPAALVHGSDRPVVAPTRPTGDAARRRLVENPARLLRLSPTGPGAAPRA